MSHKQHIKEFFQCSLSNRFMLKLFILQDIPAFSCVKTNVVDLCILVYFVSLKTISRWRYMTLTLIDSTAFFLLSWCIWRFSANKTNPLVSGFIMRSFGCLIATAAGSGAQKNLWDKFLSSFQILYWIWTLFFSNFVESNAFIVPWRCCLKWQYFWSKVRITILGQVLLILNLSQT